MSIATTSDTYRWHTTRCSHTIHITKERTEWSPKQCGFLDQHWQVSNNQRIDSINISLYHCRWYDFLGSPLLRECKSRNEKLENTQIILVPHAARQKSQNPRSKTPSSENIDPQRPLKLYEDNAGFRPNCGCGHGPYGMSSYISLMIYIGKLVRCGFNIESGSLWLPDLS